MDRETPTYKSKGYHREPVTCIITCPHYHILVVNFFHMYTRIWIIICPYLRCNGLQVLQLRNWLKGWHEQFSNTGGNKKGKKQNDSTSKKAVLLSGTPGIGKTTSAKLVCQELGFLAIEVVTFLIKCILGKSFLPPCFSHFHVCIEGKC